ncbi:hypothetical protein C2845_PM15G20430 [Panicum miliaceum]|uniref:DUF674 family protein n=1 Tax=Panicum miliaceum TaxID=4540 RepID=A0A3L6Q5F5_PANMI|nr:hypothetical protein C2845_PM15G20430 [Panicum miliaceum]
MAKIEEPTIDVMLFVDKEKRMVLFAEADKDFIDVLFGWLTLSLGTIVRLLNKHSQMRCLDQVYNSVEDLSADYFQTKACKGMLLAPLNAASGHCCQLKINIDDTKKVCKRGKDMQYTWDRLENHGNLAPAREDADSGVFVNGCFKFIITDDLIVAPASTSLMMSLFQRFGVGDPATLEKTTFLCSLRNCILTNKMMPIKKLSNVKIRVLQTRNNSLLYAEVSDDFVDLLFGSLSVPLGSMIKTYCHRSLKGCVDNLYRSIYGSAKGCVRSECQSLLLDQKAVPFSGCRTTKILQVEELAPSKLQIKGCIKCFKTGGFADLGRCLKQTPVYSRNFGRIRYYEYTYCKNSVKSTNIHESNPKLPNGGSENGEAYVKGGSIKFMVTDGLNILPLSMSSTLQEVRAAQIQPGNLLENEVTLTNFQIMELLRAALVSRNALSSVLLPPEKRKLEA